jgi:glyoxylase-like metal-dependent hydrolase (beta-lactamase superfamily II)
MNNSVTRREFLAGSAAFATVLARPAHSSETGLRPVVPGVWFYQGDFLAKGQCNSVVIERRRDLVVIDANSASGALALQAELRKLSPKPVRFVLLTHHHGDHIYGNAAWTRAGAVTVAHRAMLAELARLEPARWQSQAANDAQMAAFGNAPEPPRQTFDGSSFVLDEGGQRIELHHFGTAHTRDDVVVFLPREKVLCTGDVALSMSLNSFTDSDFDHWPVVLRAVAGLDARHVLPGHGNPGGPEILAGQAQFLAALAAAIDQGIHEGESPAQIAANVHLPESLQPWVSSFMPEQIRQIVSLRGVGTR